MYHLSQTVKLNFDQAIAKVTDALKQEGFGILTEIDVKAAFQKKLGKDFRQYRILGACHPEIAYKMLQVDDKAGVLYPCNVVVQEHEDGQVEISAIEPVMMFISLHTPQAKEIAIEASEKMQKVMNSL